MQKQTANRAPSEKPAAKRADVAPLADAPTSASEVNGTDYKTAREGARADKIVNVSLGEGSFTASYMNKKRKKINLLLKKIRKEKASVFPKIYSMNYRIKKIEKSIIVLTEEIIKLNSSHSSLPADSLTAKSNLPDGGGEK